MLSDALAASTTLKRLSFAGSHLGDERVMASSGETPPPHPALPHPALAAKAKLLPAYALAQRHQLPVAAGQPGPLSPPP
jgi:hypothetical protein